MMDRRQPDQQAASQGDAEKLAGHVPSPLMDRDRKCELGAIQLNTYNDWTANKTTVGFLTGICIPCYSLLYKLIPETKPMLDQCQANLERWRQIDEETKRQKDKACGVDALTFLDKVLESTEKDPDEHSQSTDNIHPEDTSEVHETEPQITGEMLTTVTEDQTVEKDIAAEEVALPEGKITEETIVETVGQEEKTPKEKRETDDKVESGVTPEEGGGIREDKEGKVDMAEANTDHKELEGHANDLDVSVVIQQLTDEDVDLEMHGTIRVEDATVVHHKASSLGT
ncbi:hypothetical protein C0J52_02623 [Blattella germanica]|nr:hypothetical protein C0J52_02623 [Blattella germanica]